MNIVVTGALGHIGSCLIRTLPDVFPHPNLVLVDSLSTQRFCSYFNLPKAASYRLIEQSIQTCNFDALLPNTDVLIHLAATTDAAGSAEKPDLVFENNLTATQIIAQACLRHNVPVIFPSSTSVYGSQSHLVDENCTELKPQSPYAECKIKEEQLLQTYAQKGLCVAICRFGTIYGMSPGMRFHTAVKKFCWQAAMGQELTVWETAMDQKRPYLCLRDAVRMICWIADKKLYGNGIYNVVSGNHTVKEIINIIKQKIPDLKIALVEHRIMNQLSYEVSNQKTLNTEFTYDGNIMREIDDTLKILHNQLN